MNKLKKADHSVPFAGSGKLSDFKQDGSWMMNQIEKGYDNIDRGVKIIKDENNNIQFASIHHEKKIAKIASKLVASEEEIEIEFNKQYVLLKDSCLALKWNLTGDVNGVTIQDLNLIKELLFNKIEKDMNKINYFFNPIVKYMGDACFDFENKCVKVECIL